MLSFSTRQAAYSEQLDKYCFACGIEVPWEEKPEARLIALEIDKDTPNIYRQDDLHIYQFSYLVCKGCRRTDRKRPNQEKLFEKMREEIIREFSSGVPALPHYTESKPT